MGSYASSTSLALDGISTSDGGPGIAIPACLWYWLSDKGAASPHRTALIDFQQSRGHLANLSAQSSETNFFQWTFAELILAAERLAGYLDQKGTHKGDTIVTFVDNSAEWVVMLWAAIRIGAVVTSHDPSLLDRRDDLQSVIDSTRPKVVLVKDTLGAAKLNAQSRSWQSALQLVCDGSTDRLLENWELISAISVPLSSSLPVPEMEPEDIVFTVYTGGARSDQSKACPHSTTNLISAIETSRLFYGSCWDSETIFVPTSKSSTATAYLSAINTCSAGGCIVVADRTFYPESTLEAVHKAEATHLVLLQAQLRAILSCPDFDKLRPSTLKFVNITGNAVGTDLLNTAKAKLATTRIILSWAMNEGGPVFGWQTASRIPSYNKIPMLGPALPGSKVKICISGTDEPASIGELGDLHICSDSIIHSYAEGFGDSFYSEGPDDWFITGDLAVMEEYGAVSVVGRCNDVIKYGGWALLPSKIEDYIKEFFGIESQAVGIPNPSGGEKPVAVIKVRRASADLKQEMKQGLSRHSGSEYALGAVYLLSELGLKDWPLGQTRKISKTDLRNAILTRFPTTSSKNGFPMSMYDMSFLDELNHRF